MMKKLMNSRRCCNRATFLSTITSFNSIRVLLHHPTTITVLKSTLLFFFFTLALGSVKKKSTITTRRSTLLFFLFFYSLWSVSVTVNKKESSPSKDLHSVHSPRHLLLSRSPPWVVFSMKNTTRSRVFPSLLL